MLTPDDSDYHFRVTAGLRDPVTMDKIESGKINIVKGEVDEFRENGLVIKGQLYEADTVIFATGFETDYFVTKRNEDGLWNYRHMLIPGKRNVAILGAILHFCPNLITSLQACWLVDVLRGHVKVVSVEDMEKSIKKRQKEVWAYYPKHLKGHILLSSYSLDQSWVDVLLEDMAIETVRDKNMFNYWFNILNISRYETVITHHT